MKEKFENRRTSGTLRIKLERNDHDCGKYWEADKSEVIRKIIRVVEDYSRQGYKLTLRQVYYQLVAANVIPNDNAAYGKLSSLLDDCRYSGLVDWEDIEDRGRVPYTPYYEESVEDAILRTKSYYSLDKREGQPFFIELWSEKDAISNILKSVVRKYTITVGINKGFASSTAIYNAYTRLVGKILEEGKEVVILYFGDHDPSGLDMVRDITDRLEYMMASGVHQGRFIERLDEDNLYSFLNENPDLNRDVDSLLAKDNLSDKERERLRVIFARLVVRNYFTVKHIGLTMEQVRKYNLPPNPAKLTDPRAKEYVLKYGDISWEVDALQPSAISGIIEESLEELIDFNVYNGVKEKEKKDISILEQLAYWKRSSFASDEVGQWDCPQCGSRNEDKEYIRLSACTRCGSGVYLSDVVSGLRKVKLQ